MLELPLQSSSTEKTNMGYIILAGFLVLFALVGLVIGIAGLANSKNPEYRGDSRAARAVGLGGFIAFAGFLLVFGIATFASTFYQNGVGEAKVIINSVDKTVVGTIETPGSGFKSPLEDFVEFDLFSQEITYAGNEENTPSYAGGNVTGKEVTVTVGGISGGSTRANIDISVVYSLDSDAISDIYNDYKSQERFTQMVVEKSIRSLITTVPSNYTAQEFRGAKKPEAAQEILVRANDQLSEYGIEVAFVNIQDPRYPEAVEQSLADIEKANQAAQQAEAEKRTAEVTAEKRLIEAQGTANAKIEEARGEAEANRLLAESLTPQVVELRRIEGIVEASKNGNYIIDGGNGDLLLDTRK